MHVYVGRRNPTEKLWRLLNLTDMKCHREKMSSVLLLLVGGEEL